MIYMEFSIFAPQSILSISYDGVLVGAVFIRSNIQRWMSTKIIGIIGNAVRKGCVMQVILIMNLNLVSKIASPGGSDYYEFEST